MTFTWFFGDGNSVSGTVVNGMADAMHTYPADGQFSAFLELSDTSQTVFSDSIQIQVGAPNNAPTLNGTAANPESGDPPLLVTFTGVADDLDGDPLTYEVFFGNGLTSGTQNVPAGGQISHQYTYPVDGSFDAFIVVSDGIDSVQSNSIEFNVGATQLPPVTGGLVLLWKRTLKCR